MFREMRRKKQQMSAEDCEKLLKCGTSGVLAVSGDDGYPYAVPISYALEGSKIYFHCAKSGHKLDAVKKSSKVSFCVIGMDEVLPEKYTTRYKSVIVFGKIRIVEDAEGKELAARLLAEKYCPNSTQELFQEEISTGLPPMVSLELDIEHMTGKIGKELL